MRKIILVVLVLLAICLLAKDKEWINVGGKDFAITKIDTLQGIVIVEGQYDITITAQDTVLVKNGGLGRYFFYEDNPNNTKIKLPDDMKKRLKDKLKPKKDK